MKTTVIIPTYKRPKTLLQGLASLQNQSLREFEIIVVDNAAQSEIHSIVSDLNRKTLLPVRYLAEPKSGLHNARHAGAQAAKGDLLIFTDDDATFDRGWLQAFIGAFAEHPEMVAAGGPVRPIWEVPPPRWLKKYWDSRTVFPILSLMEPHKEFTVSSKGFFFGVNMAVRRKTLFEMGGFNPDSFGDVWLGNGETGLNHKLWERGMFVGYVPDAVVYHHIPADRMTVKYFKRRMENEGACDIYTRFHENMPGQLGLLWHALSIILRSGVFWLTESLISGRTDWLSLRVQLQAARSRAQLQYVFRLMRDEDFRQFVLKQDWLKSPCTSR